MESLDTAEMVAKMRQRGPFADDRAALQTLFAVLEVVGHRLPPEEREVVARCLPEPAAQVLRRAEPFESKLALSVIGDIASRERISLGLAAEHWDIVASVILDVVHQEGRALLARALPELARVLERTELEAGAGRAEFPRHAPDDLAEGHPGSDQPLCAGNPAALAHRHSVARSSDPHADTKLSSTRGLTQERDEDTLADGKPGSRRPLSSGH